MKKRLFDLLKIIISVGLITLIFTFLVDTNILFKELKQAHWGYLTVAALLMIGGTALRALRWRVLLHPLKIEVPVSRLTYLYFVGSFFNIFLPSGMGGDLVKMAMLSQDTGKGPEAIGATLVDRATGLWVLFVFALTVIPFSYHLLPLNWIIPLAIITAGGTIGGIIILGTPFLPWLGEKFYLTRQDKFVRLTTSIARLGSRALSMAFLISILFDILLIIFNILVALSLDIKLPFVLFILFTPLISLSLTLPISIAGLGTREMTYIALFSVVGISPEKATVMSLFNYIITSIFVGLVGGLIYALNSAREFVQRELGSDDRV